MKAPQRLGLALVFVGVWLGESFLLSPVGQRHKTIIDNVPGVVSSLFSSSRRTHSSVVNYNNTEMADWSDWMRGMETEASVNQYMELDSLDGDDLLNIESYWDQILPTVNYLGTATVSCIYQALCVAYHAHKGQMRKSGEPFIIHPVEVAILLSNLKMDGETVMAGLLHDTVEDTSLTFENIEELFGETVRKIVEGETKVSKLPKHLEKFTDEQAENLRQMFVAMTDDYRIIIVKLADRLHNMRTLGFMKPAKQTKIARETLDIFAPLAHRMGIWQFKSELEDTAFKYLYPNEYKQLSQKLRTLQTHYRDILERSQTLLENKLNNDPTLQQNATVEVFGRTKEIYSLWHKMETKNLNLENIMDVVALRVIITPNEDSQSDRERGVWLCYHVLCLVHHLTGVQPVPTKVKDYISFPKPNGYQSLHTALILDGQNIEVQIRTSLMHQVAEYGMASHWLYKEKRKYYNTPWLSSIKEWQNDRISSRDFVDSVRRELLGKRVFVFLRNGKILNLARGATAIDVAFQIHTEIGLKMHGANINGKPVPFSYELQNGDVVSILSGRGKPQTDWMRYAKSRSTRSKLRSYFRAQQKEHYKEAGKILIMDCLFLHRRLIEKESHLGDVYVPTINVKELQELLPGRTKYTEVDDLLVAVGKEHDRNFLHSIVSELFGIPKNRLVEAENAHNRNRNGMFQAGQLLAEDVAKTFMPKPLPIWRPDRTYDGFNDDTEYADPDHVCGKCLPVHGDAIVGTRKPGKDFQISTVHRIGCFLAQNALNKAKANHFVLSPGPKVDSVSLRQMNQEKGADGVGMEIPVNLEWSESDDSTFFRAEIVVIAEDRKMLLADCSVVVSESVEIIQTGSQTTAEHATLEFLVEVKDLDDIQNLMDKLNEIPSVMSVERRFGSSLLLK